MEKLYCQNAKGLDCEVYRCWRANLSGGPDRLDVVELRDGEYSCVAFDETMGALREGNPLIDVELSDKLSLECLPCLHIETLNLLSDLFHSSD